jgi:ribosomal protein S18 acetylase RimI-like enzyme
MIRPYTDDDIAQLDELTRGFQDYMVSIDQQGGLHAFVSPEAAHNYMGKLISDINEMEGAIYVAVENDKVIGFVQGIIDRHTDEGDVLYNTTHKPAVDGWVGVLYVSPEYRGKKLGLALLDTIKGSFKEHGCDTLRLSVMFDNASSVKFYEAYGMRTHDVEFMLPL